MEKVKIKNIFDFQKKSKIKAGDGFKLGEAQYPFYTSSNELTKSINEYLFEDESLIFGTGGLASIHFCNEKFAVSTDCFVIQPKDKKRVFSKFVYYYLSGNMNILENGFKGAGLKHISKDYLENIEIPLPNLATQQRIAAILDQADAIIQNNRAIVQKYDALTQSLFLDMFGDPVKNEKGWEKKNGVEYSNKISVGVVIKPASNYVDEGVIALRSLNVKPNKIDLTDLVFFSKEAHNNELSKSKLNKGDVVIIRTGSTGTAAIIPQELDNINCIDLIIVKPNLKFINPKYLVYFFNSERGKNLVSGHEVGGIQKHFNIGSIKKIEIPTPPIELQNQFAERVAIIEAQKQQAQLELAKSEELFQSLLQRAFNGELS